MFLLIAGVILWSGAHLFKRFAPTLREAMGNTGKAAIALAIFASLAMMIFGYRMADGPFFWGRSPALVGINNLMMLVAVYFLLTGEVQRKSTSVNWLRKHTKHPMLNALKTWAIAHILVNGDLASFILFGGLLTWAVIQMIVINRTEPAMPDPRSHSWMAEAKVLGATLVTLVIIMGIHYLLGYQPWG